MHINSQSQNNTLQADHEDERRRIIGYLWVCCVDVTVQLAVVSYIRKKMAAVCFRFFVNTFSAIVSADSTVLVM